MSISQAEKKATILVIEDRADMAWTLRTLLEGQGHSVLVAQSGEEALDMLGLGDSTQSGSSIQLDLILLDIMPGKLDGCQVCERIRQDERMDYIPVIMLTVRGSLQDIVRGLDCGADDYVAKPFDNAELLARIRAMLRIKKLHDDRLRAEKALWESEERLRVLVNALPDLIFLFDEEDHYLEILTSQNHLLIKDAEKLMGKHVADVLPNHLAQIFLEALDRTIESGDLQVIEYELDVIAGRRWFGGCLDPVSQRIGSRRTAMFVSRDITGRKRVEEALRKAHEELERRVDKRTAELAMANEQLKREIGKRRQTEEELLCSQEEVLRNHHLLLALCQAAQSVQRARTPEEVYRTIGDEVAELGYHAMIFALTDDRERVTLSHATFEPASLRRVEELSGFSVLGFRFPLAPDGLFRRIIAEGESIFCECTAELVAQGLPQLRRSLIERLVAILGIEKSIYAPLRVSGETHGLLGVASTCLTEADVPAVTGFANQAGIAIENAQLLEQVGASREQLRRLTQQIISTQEEERQRLSRALHDEAGQALTALKICLELIGEDLPVGLGSFRQRLGDAAALTTTTMEQVRSLAQDLRPPALDALGLNPTLEGFCRDFAKRTQLPIDYLGLELPMLPEAVNTCLYRFLQEALTNVAKHACANQVCVALRYDAKTVSLSVEDDGRGFDTQARLSVVGWPMGIGLLGMQERLESLDGRLEIESRPGQGTRLVAHLPAGGNP